MRGATLELKGVSHLDSVDITIAFVVIGLRLVEVAKVEDVFLCHLPFQACTDARFVVAQLVA